MIHIRNPVYYHKFQVHILAYVTPAYSEPCHIQNPGIFRTEDKFRTLLRHILAYSERCVTLAYWEPCHIQNFVIFKILAYVRPEAYSKSCLYRHIQAYSGIFNNDSHNNINLFFALILHNFQRKTFLLTTVTSISMLDGVYVNNTRSFKIVL